MKPDTHRTEEDQITVALAIRYVGTMPGSFEKLKPAFYHIGKAIEEAVTEHKLNAMETVVLTDYFSMVALGAVVTVLGPNAAGANLNEIIKVIERGEATLTEIKVDKDGK